MTEPLTQLDTQSGLFLVPSAVTGAVKGFYSIAGAFAWGNAASANDKERLHALVVAGEAEDGAVVSIREVQAPWAGLVNRAIDLKDAFLLTRLYAPEQPPGLLHDLRNVEGLTKYTVVGRRGELPIYEETEPTKRWPCFREFTHKAYVIALPTTLTGDMESAYEAVSNGIASKKILVDKTFCPTVDRLSDIKKPTDARSLAVFHAFVYVVKTLLDQAERRRRPKVEADNGPSFPWDDPRKG
jgi:hypothetical protein